MDLLLVLLSVAGICFMLGFLMGMFLGDKYFYIDVKRSLLFDEDAAKITLKLLDNFGTINVGYEPKSIYDCTKEYNPNVGKISLNEVSDIKLPSNTSVNVDKMNKLLKNKKKDL